MITSAAQRLRCDLIVMGTHGLSGLEKVLIGSTTERMLRRASLPILAVPSIPSGSERRTGAGAPMAWSGDLVPVDLREQSTRDIRDAELIARAFGASLVLVHVVPPLQTPPWYRADLSAHDRMRVAKAQHQLESLAKRSWSWRQRRNARHGRNPGGRNRRACGRSADRLGRHAPPQRSGPVWIARRMRSPRRCCATRSRRFWRCPIEL